MRRWTRALHLRALLGAPLLVALAAACAATPKESAQLLVGAPEVEDDPAGGSGGRRSRQADRRGSRRDSDGDGIPDADDRCPIEPENLNGYQDQDGCPDEIPEKVRGYSATLEGVHFGGESGGSTRGARPRPSSAADLLRSRPSVNSGERYTHAEERGRIAVADAPRSTFSVDVDTASYANVRRFLRAGALPPPDAVRVEEMLNYFRYAYPKPQGDEAIAVHTEVGPCPWDRGRRLVRIGLSSRTLPKSQLPPRNLVFLVDVSGSMQPAEKLPLVKAGLDRLVDTLGARDRIALVAYAGAAGVVLPPTPGDRKVEIRQALARLEAGGSTAGGAGIELAYALARERFDPKGANRVILATDGDFNVGPTSDGALIRLIEEKRRSGVHLTVLGVGRGDLNDAMMEQLADKGDGHYAYLDSYAEAERARSSGGPGGDDHPAKDVKIQVEWNPLQVAEYRLIGYDPPRRSRVPRRQARRRRRRPRPPGHRALRGQAPRDDPKDMSKGTGLKDPPGAGTSPAARSDELATVSVRSKSADGASVRERSTSVRVGGGRARGDQRRLPLRAARGRGVRGPLRGAPAEQDAAIEARALPRRRGPRRRPHGERAELLALFESWPAVREAAARATAAEEAWAREEAEAAAEERRRERQRLQEERAARRLSPARALARASAITPEAREGLERTAEVLRAYPGVRIEISGHADGAEGRSAADRLAYSRARAVAVREVLVGEFGIDRARIEVRAAGEGEPIDTNETARGRARNRRVEFKVLRD
ncbi:MAG: von Willebrand factor type A domain-containing protein [Nannocystaceae bacterium]